MYYLGVDLGSLSCDAVLIDDGGNILGSGRGLPGHHPLEQPEASATRSLPDSHWAAGTTGPEWIKG